MSSASSYINPITSSPSAGATGHLTDHSNIKSALSAIDGFISTSSGLLSALSDDTGTGSVVFNTSPTFLGTVSASNVTISGDLYVAGSTTYITASNIATIDPIIYTASGNNTNNFDIGLVGAFNNGTYQHTGLLRDHSDGKWKLFSRLSSEPNTSSVSLASVTYDPIRVGGIEINSSSSTTSASITSSGNMTVVSASIFQSSSAVTPLYIKGAAIPSSGTGQEDTYFYIQLGDNSNLFRAYSNAGGFGTFHYFSMDGQALMNQGAVIRPNFANRQSLIIKQESGQTANLQEWMAVDGTTVLASISPLGNFTTSGTASVAGNTYLPATASVGGVPIVGTTSTQTLTNKTLTSASISGTGAIMLGSTSNSTTLKAQDVAIGNTATLPVGNVKIAGANFDYATATASNNSTTSYVSPSGVSGFTVYSGRAYKFEANIFYQMSTTAAAFRARITYPTLTAGAAQAFMYNSTTAVTSALSSSMGSGSTTFVGSNATASATTYLARINGFILPSASGTIGLDFGPTTGTASALAGSWFTVTEVE